MIKNWLLIPFKKKENVDLSNWNPIDIILKNDMKLSEDQTYCHLNYSPTQLLRHCLYMIMTQSSTQEQYNFIYRNVHGGAALSSGYTKNIEGNIHYCFQNTIQSLSALNLLLTLDSSENSNLIKELYETLIIENFIDNDLTLKKPDKLFILRSDPETFCGLNCESDNAVVLLAILKTLETKLKVPKMKELFNKYNNLYGFKYKLRFSSNKPEVMLSLLSLFHSTTDYFYFEQFLKRSNNLDPDNYIANLYVRG